jgi:citrate synthase
MIKESKIKGFGHVLYKHSADPRSDIMKSKCRKLAKISETSLKTFKVSEQIEKVNFENKILNLQFPSVFSIKRKYSQT